jgi:hypothetical protein
VPAGNHRNLAALGLYLGYQRRLLLRGPLPTELNDNLAIHSKDSFWTLQKDQASLSALAPTTRRRPVQTGRLPEIAVKNVSSGHF